MLWLHSLASIAATALTASSAYAATIACFIAYEAIDGCSSASKCDAGYNKVWFKDDAGIHGAAPRWLLSPSKIENEIYYVPRNDFVNSAALGDPKTFNVKFGELVVFVSNARGTQKYEYYQRCKAQPE